MNKVSHHGGCAALPFDSLNSQPLPGLSRYAPILARPESPFLPPGLDRPRLARPLLLLLDRLAVLPCVWNIGGGILRRGTMMRHQVLLLSRGRTIAVFWLMAVRGRSTIDQSQNPWTSPPQNRTPPATSRSRLPQRPGCVECSVPRPAG